ncbi:hypothetical protein D3C87_363810 [compost metagenome]
MQPKAEVKITHGKESMTKSGKIFSIFQLLQTVDGWINVEGEVVPFQPLELFRVRRGQRGAMSVELELGDDRFVPLGIGEDKQSIVVVDPITGSTLLMNWSRTSIEEQAKGLGDPVSQGQEKIIQLELGTGPVVTHWVDGPLSADVTFDSPDDLQRLGNFRKEEDFSKKLLACIAHNIEQLREPNTFELEFFVNIGPLGEKDPIVAIHGDQTTVYRLDLDSKDMFATHRLPNSRPEFEQAVTETDHVRVVMSNVKRAVNKGVAPKLFSFEEAEANFIPASKLEEQEIYDLLGAERLEAAIKAILLSETSPLARKWMNSYVVRVVTMPESFEGRLHIERVRSGDKAEGRGDIYQLDVHGDLTLDRHRMPVAACEGPVFYIEDIVYKSASIFSGRDAGRDYGSRRGTSDGRGNERDDARMPRRADMEVSLHRRTEEPARSQSKIPTREWIPQINQFVYIEDDAKKEMYFIADYDQYEHKFLLVLADSLRRERAARTATGRPDLTNEKGQLPVEPGRLRPFVLFH